MIEVIFELFVEIVFQGIILGFFRVVKGIGLFVLKLMTSSNKSLPELKEKYKNSSLPYFLGFGVTFRIIYLLVMVVS